MRFVSLVNNVIAKARRGITQTASVSADDLKDPGKQAEIIRQLMARINKLEAAAAPEATEFEVLVGDGGQLVELPHGFKSTAVRWSVVGWFCVPAGASPVDAPRLTYDPSSTLTSLFLRSYVKGRAIIRVEPAQSFLDPGPTIDVAQGIPNGRQTFKGTFSNLLANPLITVRVPDNSACTWRVCVIGQDTVTLASRAIVSWSMHARRQLGAGVIDLVNVVDLATATANYIATAVVSGNDINITGQCLVAGPRTVTWTAFVEPIVTYLRDEP
jgi:hypothetical protein